MSALAETLLAALCLSGLAACCLVWLRHTPPRVRFAIAATGLAAWLVPWGAIRIALPVSGTAPPLFVEWLGAAPLAVEPSRGATAGLGYALAAAFLVGLALFVRDCCEIRRRLRDWRARSRSADVLRAWLPPDLADVVADIRIVEGSAVAAASGVRAPTIWLGDSLTDAQRRLALVHEAWHVRARDPLWVALIAAVRRAYWWNPLVAYLARQAVLMLESTCDHRCAAHCGTGSYRAGLASLLLAAPSNTPRLVAGITTSNLDIQRLRLLGEPLRVRVRDLALLAALATTGAAATAAAVVDYERTLPAPPGFALPATPAGDALATLLRAANGRDSELLAELLSAYTPQELALPLPDSEGIRIVDVRHSEPLRIEYVAEAPRGGRYLGELALAAAATTRITATRLQPLP